MLDHHIQRTIVYRLAFSDGLSFTKLKPDTIENKLFTYHLQKVIKAGYVQKSASGQYTLTLLGRQLGMRALDKQPSMAEAPESVCFLIIRRASDMAWLLYKRNTHPLRSYVGFMHCLPQVDVGATMAAHYACLDKTGVEGSFTALGSGYSRLYDEAGLESFTHFTLLYCEDAQGEITQGDDYADYFWSVEPDFSSPDFFPTTQALLELYNRKRPFFIELRAQL